jgi:Stress responsive A/B Barrel Domain
MIKHIVVWRLKESAHGNSRATNARLIKEKLESLNGKIPGMIKIEVGLDYSATESSSDVVLYSEFVSRQALDEYKSHSEHKAVQPFILEAWSERRLVDYEI